MRLTPIEIRRHRFQTRMRGFDREEVRTFLDIVLSDFEDVVRENAKLRRDAERMGRDLEIYQGKEQNIHETLVTTQGLVDELKRTAIRESELIVSEAQARAEKILMEMESYRADLSTETAELRHIRNRVEIDLRKTLQGYLSLVDAYQKTSQRPASTAGRAAETEGGTQGS